MSSPYEFEETVYQLGVVRCVDVPKWISDALGGASHIPVLAKIGQSEARTTLTPRGEGRHRLFLSAEQRKRSGVDSGSLARFSLTLDLEDREPQLPEDLRVAMEAEPGTIETYFSISTSKRRQLMAYIDAAKRPRTREKHLAKALEWLRRG